MTTTLPPNGTGKRLGELLAARYPVIYIVSGEESRVESAISAVVGTSRRLLTWTFSKGLADSTGEIVSKLDPTEVLQAVAASKEPCVYVLKDFHRFVDDALVCRFLRDLAAELPAGDVARAVVILAPALKLPDDLRADVTVLDWPLPTREQLAEILASTGQDGTLTPPERERVLDAAQGLAATECENVFALSLARGRTLDPAVVVDAKRESVRKSGVLDFADRKESLDDVAGLDLLKPWLLQRRRAFSPDAQAFGLDTPRGCLVVGPPGTGKSLTARAVSAAWGLPLIRFDVAKLLGSLVGESEANLRAAIKVVESVAPCVVWLDEIEKALAGSGTDTSGVSTRLVGSLLTWMAEKTAPVYVVATANDVSALPPELLRAGRFDAVWFVDLPTVAEREAILAVHLHKRKRVPSKFRLHALAESAEGFSGAEIEQAVIEALHAAFDAEREITDADLTAAVANVVPLSRTAKERLNEVREWAKGRARPASSPERKADNSGAGRFARVAKEGA